MAAVTVSVHRSGEKNPVEIIAALLKRNYEDGISGNKYYQKLTFIFRCRDELNFAKISFFDRPNSSLLSLEQLFKNAVTKIAIEIIKGYLLFQMLEPNILNDRCCPHPLFKQQKNPSRDSHRYNELFRLN